MIIKSLKKKTFANMRYTPLPPWHCDNLRVDNKICTFIGRQ